jgi:hypothetical protein
VCDDKISPTTQEVEIAEDHALRQKVIKTPISTNKVSMVVYKCNPNYKGGIDRMTVVPGWPR